MKILGGLLLLSGWLIAAGAVLLLVPGVARIAFVLSGIGVEVIGLVLFARAHPLLRSSASQLSRGERE